MPLNHKTIRANIRRAWSRGDSNPRNRGAWSNPNSEFRLSADPLDYRETYWRFFGSRYDAITLTVVEAYEEERTYTITYKVGPPYTRTVTEDQTYDFSAAATRPDIRVYGVPWTTPPAARIIHVSASPYGEGLYEARGIVSVQGDTHYTSTPTDTEPPTPTTVDDYDTDIIELFYRSDATAINGRMTPCMVVAGQFFAGPLTKWEPYPRPDQEFLPFPADEYGYTDPAGTSVEVYHSATFLDNLITGGMTDVTIRNTGALSDTETFPDPLDPVDTYTSDHSWTRSGTFTLAIS